MIYDTNDIEAQLIPTNATIAYITHHRSKDGTIKLYKAKMLLNTDKMNNLEIKETQETIISPYIFKVSCYYQKRYITFNILFNDLKKIKY
ncbi:hypothetical protein Hokovirus_1_67 [Hokovirus HKV1]|uniref:Uncharacterized protein n=1 Tax=Hokovirus HKV1 TaxID=1977638 RepID=A0A1V0SEX5_9VIRU|nr:hypothetical protein Hokovirus_1_67 [Hokovirus HKV1]